MSEQNDPRVPYPDDGSDEARTEYGRQLAMDSILEAALGAAAEKAKKERVMPPRRRWPGMAAAAAAVVVLGAGAAFWVMRGGPLEPRSEQAAHAEREPAGAQGTTPRQDAALPEGQRSAGVASPAGDAASAAGADQEAVPPAETRPPAGRKPPPDAADPVVIDHLATNASQGTGDPSVPQFRIWSARGGGAPGSAGSPQPSRQTAGPGAGSGLPQGGVMLARQQTQPGGLVTETRTATGSDTFFYNGARRPSDTVVTVPQGQRSDSVVTGGQVLHRWNAISNREGYDHFVENAFKRPAEHPLSTFSIDVDTAAYSNIRDLLRRGQLPPKDAVRIEEMINYFDYVYAPPVGEHPIGIHVDVAAAPWAPEHKLVRVGLQARNLHERRPNANLVFLIDVSGSMQPANKLPLLKQVMAKMVDALRDEDRVAIVTYAGRAGLVLDSTAVGDEEKVHAALARLDAGGSTNGGAGIQLAYKVARENLVKGGINRVILASDGDFNVGTTDRGSLIRLIESERESGVFLSVLGFGRGNLRDSQMEQIADKGNGAYHYIDSVQEGCRVLVDKIGASLMTVAKDVKVQIEFNPGRVAGYRLIGYENRMLAKEDFNDDSKDAGEVGSGHTVTALYEVAPLAAGFPGVASVDPLRYGTDGEEVAPQEPAPPARASEELLFVKVRYKQPDGSKSVKLDQAVKDVDVPFAQASDDLQFVAAVAAFGMVLRDSAHKGLANFATVLDMAEGAIGEDPRGLRREFVGLVEKARDLDRRRR